MLLTIALVISFALSASGAAMEFRTFTNPDMGVQGILPVGWTEKNPGEFAREASDADETVLVQLGIPNITIEQMKVFLLPRLRIEELPESTRSIRNDNFAWDLYTVESEGSTGEKIIVDMALAQADGWVYLALLGTMPDERDVLYYEVFGKGRVFLSAPHPEAHADTRALTLAAVEWCTGRSDPENNQSPLIQADIPSEGVVNHLFVCSAAGSRDPNGLPIGFIWYFGDASPKQYRPEAVHVYQQPGTYTVTLTVTNGNKHSIKSTEVIIHEPQ